MRKFVFSVLLASTFLSPIQSKADVVDDYLFSLPATTESQFNIEQYAQIRSITGTFIVVNIPSFELVVFKDKQIVLRSKVVVGKVHAKTPLFTTTMTAIKFNPDWTPTPNMISSAIAHDRKVPHHTHPGPRNPLGLLKFELDDDMNIYLHDTNERKLFDRDVRSFSHGCVRVQKFVDLASIVLGWTPEQIQNKIDEEETEIVPLDHPVLVFFVYMTYWPDENGIIQHYKDIYNRLGK